MANPITVSSPLPAQDLFFESMHYRAGLSSLGELELDLLSPKSGLDPLALLGQPLTVSVLLRDGAKRHFSGLVSRFGMGRPVAQAAQGGAGGRAGPTSSSAAGLAASAAQQFGGAGQGRYFSYRAVVVPWLWFLTRTADCRIFQDQTVPDIVKAVFGDHPIASFEFKLFRSYRKLGYCVQYRESDYHFVARLLEEEGIYWYVEHSDGAHKVVLVDATGAHDASPHCASLPYTEDLAHAPPDKEFATRWSFAEGVKTGKVALTSYDFERPSTSLKVDAVRERSYSHSDYEVFDFEGDYIQSADGSQYADNMADALQTRFIRHHAHANALGVEVGRRLKITRHPRDKLNAEYLITDVNVHAQLAEHGSAFAQSHFECEFSAIPAAQQFRPGERTRKPVVQGPQTAVVVGPAGEEIFTDKYGRVKVQFHWDRYGKRDEKSSCWVRVSQPWAGKNFGFMQIPRIGQEVVVDFLEGDPDQPLITGRVYNAEQMPPWDLPANATQSGVLTRSSQGGSYGTANALRFEDKKGSEQLWLHAEKNQDIEVENDETLWVGHDRTKTVDHDETTHVKHDRTETVDNNETITIGVNRTEMVGSNESITIGSNRSITVGGSETATVAMQRTHAVGVNESIAIGAAQEIAIGAAQVVAVGAAQSISVGANQSTSVGADQSTSVGAKQSTDVGADRSINVGGGQTTNVAEARSTSIGKDDKLQVGKKFYLEAADEITLKTGDASITLKKDGTIQIKGKDITLSGSGKIGVKASSDLVLKGSKIAQN